MGSPTGIAPCQADNVDSLHDKFHFKPDLVGCPGQPKSGREMDAF